MGRDQYCERKARRICGSTKNPGKNQSTNARAISGCTYAAKVGEEEAANRTTRDVGSPPARDPRLLVVQKVWEETDNVRKRDLSVRMCCQTRINEINETHSAGTQESLRCKTEIVLPGGATILIREQNRDIPGSGVTETVAVADINIRVTCKFTAPL
jgi:hypothetical protein